MLKTLTGEEIPGKAITYFAFAKDSKGEIRQMKIVRIHAAGFRPIKAQSFTEVVYPSIKEAEKDMKRLNCLEPF